MRDDDELAMVLAHRMAHRHAEHAEATPFLARLGDFVGLDPESVPEPVFDDTRERAADRVSLFVLARPGVDPAAAVRFWRRMTSLPSRANDWLVRHPVSAERIERIEGIATEIQMLRAADQPLKP